MRSSLARADDPRPYAKTQRTPYQSAALMRQRSWLALDGEARPSRPSDCSSKWSWWSLVGGGGDPVAGLEGDGARRREWSAGDGGGLEQPPEQHPETCASSADDDRLVGAATLLASVPLIRELFLVLAFPHRPVPDLGIVGIFPHPESLGLRFAQLV